MKKKHTIIGQDQNKKILNRAIDLNLAILIIGETGTGKTSVVQELAETKKQELIRINLNGQTSVDEILGKWLIRAKETYWQDGVLIQAMRQGKWILIDRSEEHTSELQSQR